MRGGSAGVVVAAGSGTRLGADIPKAFVRVAGTPMFLWPLRAMGPAVDRIVLVVPQGYEQTAEQLCVDARVCGLPAIVAGGPERQGSVYRGLATLADFSPEVVVIHDGARPLLTTELVTRCIAGARDRGAVVAAIRCVDTLKRADVNGRILGTSNRDEFWRAQTPQAFRYDLIMSAYERARAEGWSVTDDAALAEMAGHEVYVTEGNVRNMKVTTAEDLRMAEALLGEPGLRIGHGFDVHKLVGGRRLIIGGVEIDYAAGLAGHSDADVLFHAIADALLGAAAMGDIGQHFPDTDPQYAGANSAQLAARVVSIIANAGFAPLNVDATVVCQAPKLAPHIPAMRANIASALGLPVDAVSVKATTTETLGFTGRREGIAAHAVAAVCRR